MVGVALPGYHKRRGAGITGPDGFRHGDAPASHRPRMKS